jgi:hypothetical protein
MYLPGWDSLDTVGRLNFWCHIAALVFIAALALAEILAFVYGERRDTLVEARAHALSVAQQQKEQATDERHAAEVADLRGQLDKTSKQVADDHSLKSRIRGLFASIDPNILHQIDSGFGDLTIRMQPPDIQRLQTLLAEPGGADLASITGFGRSWANSMIANGTLGPSAPVPQQIEVAIKVAKTLASRQ